MLPTQVIKHTQHHTTCVQTGGIPSSYESVTLWAPDFTVFMRFIFFIARYHVYATIFSFLVFSVFSVPFLHPLETC